MPSDSEEEEVVEDSEDSDSDSESEELIESAGEAGTAGADDGAAGVEDKIVDGGESAGRAGGRRAVGASADSGPARDADGAWTPPTEVDGTPSGVGVSTLDGARRVRRRRVRRARRGKPAAASRSRHRR